MIMGRKDSTMKTLSRAMYDEDDGVFGWNSGLSGYE